MSVAMQSVKQSYSRNIMTTFRNRIGDPKYLINMNETAVYLNFSTTRTLHPTGEKTVAVNIEGATSSRFTLGVSIAMDGTKLPLFAIFKGQRGGKLEKSFDQIILAGIIACVQAKGWMDNSTMGLWYNKVYRPYIGNLNGMSGLLLDDFKSHKNSTLSLMNEDNALRFMIPPH